MRKANGRLGETSKPRSQVRLAAGAATLLVLATLAMMGPGAGAATLSHRTPQSPHSTSSSTVWLCRPGIANDPCTDSLTTTVVKANGSHSITTTSAERSKFDCFYVYPTVSKELTPNADLRIQKTEIAAAVAQASRFSAVCNVWAPIYRQVTLLGLAATPNLDVSSAAKTTAYDSLASAFEDYLTHDNDGRPIVFLGHSQGAAMLILLLERMVDNDPTLRSRVTMAIIAGGNVEVPTRSMTGGTFQHLPLCNAFGEFGCVIAYSSFPAEPPSDSLFGRPGQGVSLQSDQTKTKGLSVACVNPSSLGGGTGALLPYFPTVGLLPTPWVSYPGLYSATCMSTGGATWLEVKKVSGASDHRPTVTESAGPQWGYHTDDINLALGNLVADVAAAESAWLKAGKQT